jgi:hypothetical protein
MKSVLRSAFEPLHSPEQAPDSCVVSCESSPLELTILMPCLNTMLYAAGASVLGVHLVLFALLARTVGVLKNVLPMTHPLAPFLRVFTLERGILLGASVGLIGLALAAYSVDSWAHARLGALDPSAMMRVAIPSVTLMLAGAEIVFASFLLGFIDLRTRKPGDS